MLRLDCVDGYNLYVTDDLPEEAIRGEYRLFRQHGVLEAFFHERTVPPTEDEFLDWALDSGLPVLGAYVCPKDGGAVMVGMGYLNSAANFKVLRRGEVGICFLRKVSPNIKLACARMMLEFLFQDLDMTVVSAKTPLKNKASLSFLKRLGFKCEASVPFYTLWRGQPCDLVISHLTKQSWEKGGGPALGCMVAGPSEVEKRS